MARPAIPPRPPKTLYALSQPLQPTPLPPPTEPLLSWDAFMDSEMRGAMAKLHKVREIEVQKTAKMQTVAKKPRQTALDRAREHATMVAAHLIVFTT